MFFLLFWIYFLKDKVKDLSEYNLNNITTNIIQETNDWYLYNVDLNKEYQKVKEKIVRKTGNKIQTKTNI